MMTKAPKQGCVPFNQRVDEFVDSLQKTWNLRLTEAQHKAAREKVDSLNTRLMRYAVAFQTETDKRLADLVAVFENEARLEKKVDIESAMSHFEERGFAAFRLVADCWSALPKIGDTRVVDASSLFHEYGPASIRWTYARLRFALMKVSEDRYQFEAVLKSTNAQLEAAIAGRRTAKWTLGLVIGTALVFLATLAPELHRAYDWLKGKEPERDSCVNQTIVTTRDSSAISPEAAATGPSTNAARSEPETRSRNGIGSRNGVLAPYPGKQAPEYSVCDRPIGRL